MIAPNHPIKPAMLEHQIDGDFEQCIWCGSTREQIEEWGERICPRREPSE